MIYGTIEEYRKAWDRAYKEDPPIPLNIDIELASICNLKCPFCFYGESEWNKEMQLPAADGKPKKRFMPTEMAERIIGQAASLGVPALKFNWRGESTLHPNYSEILKYAKKINICGGMCRDNHPEYYPFHDLLVNTNANCKDSAIDGLMCATKVMISLDSTIPEIYKKMRVNGDLNRAIEVTKELIRRGHPNIWVRRVITKLNECEDFAKNVRAIFGPKVHISEHMCFDRNATEHHQLHDPLRFERTYCGYPSQRLMIASDGTCYPCCVDTSTEMPMGNIQEQSISEIWNGDKFKTLRSELRKNIFKSKICENCESWLAYKSVNRYLVQDREIKI